MALALKEKANARTEEWYANLLTEGLTNPVFSNYRRDMFKRERVGIYPGSFNPFHKGHLNIAQKAARLFDRLVILQGWNPSKEKPTCDLSLLKSLRGFKVDRCHGLVTDYIKENFVDESVTLVRGLRNSYDLQAEINQARYYQDLMPSLNIVHIICDRDFEHISSTAIKELQKFGEGASYLVT